MNKQEAIDKINNMGKFKIRDTALHRQFDTVDKDKVLDLVSQINEPEKPVVHQLVADWYEKNKDDFEYSLYKLCIDFHEKKLRADLYGWFNDDNHKCIETLVKMKLFGYEVKKEKLYTAMLKLSDEFLRLDCNGNFDHFRVDRKYILDGAKVYQFTKDDLVKYHIWENDAYEIKEVEE